ncbi:MAG: glycosyltransferase family 4 protein [Pseudomonadota bacterium]
MRDKSPEKLSKVLLVVTEDWFVLSHFRPLIEALKSVAHDVVLVTRIIDRRSELDALGVRVLAFPFERKSLNPLTQIGIILKLSRILRSEKPDVAHFVGLNPIVLGSVASRLSGVRSQILHIIGLGYLGISARKSVRLLRKLVFSAVNWSVQHRMVWMFAENQDDVRDLETLGLRQAPDVVILGGAGVDPVHFAALPFPQNRSVVAATACRFIRSKGLDVLVAAHEKLRAKGTGLTVRMHGIFDGQNPETIDRETLEAWLGKEGIEGGYPIEDVRTLWREADIAVIPSRTREGMPRAMLEAAACGRPLIVTDLPGPREFVRDGVEGLVVPPEDPDALADAIARLVGDAELRKRMGSAARERFLSGYTERDVKRAIANAYRTISERLKAA